MNTNNSKEIHSEKEIDEKCLFLGIRIKLAVDTRDMCICRFCKSYHFDDSLKLPSVFACLIIDNKSRENICAKCLNSLNNKIEDLSRNCILKFLLMDALMISDLRHDVINFFIMSSI